MPLQEHTEHAAQWLLANQSGQGPRSYILPCRFTEECAFVSRSALVKGLEVETSLLQAGCCSHWLELGARSVVTPLL